MYLEQMSDAEVLAQYKKDFDCVRERKLNHAEKVSIRKAREANRFPFADGYHYKLRNGNDYFIVSIFFNKHQLKKRHVTSVVGSIIDTPRGKMFMHFNFNGDGKKQVDWFTAHFFKRYAQRMGMDENTPFEKILKTYFMRNPEATMEFNVTEQNGEHRIMCSIRDGACMAQMKNGKLVMMTFIPKEILNCQQTKRRNIIEPFREDFVKEIETWNHLI